MGQDHVAATRQGVQRRLLRDRETAINITSPTHDIFRKTAALISALRNTGCHALEHEPTHLTEGERECQNLLSVDQEKFRRGYQPRQRRCEGQLSLEFNDQAKPYIMYGILVSHSAII